MSQNPFTQPLRITMNDPRMDWARPLARRRQLVVAFLALLILTPTLTWTMGSVLVIAAMLVPFVFVMGSLNAGVRGLSELRPRDLDEREKSFRAPVYARLYWPGVILGVAAGLIMGNLDIGHKLFVAATGLSIFNLAFGLPTLWLAWTLPDEPSPN